MLHQSGTLVLAEGVETEDELMTLMQADVDFIQGYWFGQPKASIQAATARVPELIGQMWQRFESYERSHSRYQRPGFEGFTEAVLAGAALYMQTGDLEEAARPVFLLPDARRVFVLSDRGEQLAPSITASGTPSPPARLAPLIPDTRNNWSRRAYFKHALAAPGRVAMMGPHCSLMDGQDCYTAAVTVQRNGATHVFCVDFLPEVRNASPV